MPTQNAITQSVTDLKQKMEEQQPTILDVREYVEWTGAHLEGARHVPLGELRKQAPQLAQDLKDVEEVWLLCRSGKRAQMAADMLAQHGCSQTVVVQGGLEAWQAAGYPVGRARGPIALERQVRIAAGSFVLLGLLIPGLKFLPYVVGAGLVFAGITNTCGMALALARMPWNRAKAGDQDATGASCCSPHTGAA